MYAIFDIALNCDIPLPELNEVETADCVISITKGINSEPQSDSPDWFHHWLDEDDNIDISCAKLGHSYLLSFPDSVDFLISESGESIQYFLKPDITVETFRHLLLDQVIPRVLGHRGQLVLHASAVSVAEETNIVFVGSSGHGKSTLASSFHENGARLLSDDCLLLSEENGDIMGTPNYHGVRLFEDSANAIYENKYESSPVAHYSNKNRLHLVHPTEPTRITKNKITALFFLADPTASNTPTDITIKPVKGASELISLLRQTFILDVSDKPLIQNQFQAIHQVISSNIRMYQLQFPRRYDLLPLLRSKIEDLL